MLDANQTSNESESDEAIRMRDDQNIRQPKSHRPRIRRREWVIVFFMIVVPWVLVSVPGTAQEERTSKFGIHYVHGWPFVHLDRNVVDATHVHKSNKTPIAELARQGAIARPPLRANLRLSRYQFPTWRGQFTTPMPLAGVSSFWSDTARWPSWSPNHHWQIRPIGLICNLLILALAAVLALRLIKWLLNRLSQASRLRFSLRSLLLITAVIGGLFAWSVAEETRDQKLDRTVALLQESHRVSFYVDEEGRLSQVISQLLDHGKFPLGVSSWFARIKTINVNLSLDEYRSGAPNQLHYRGLADPSSNSKLNNVLAHESVVIHLSIEEFDRLAVDELKRLGKLNIVGLNANFNYYDWIDSFNRNRNPATTTESQWLLQAKQEMKDALTGLKSEFNDLRSLTLHLKDTYDQPSHLELFYGLKNLKFVRIWELDADGAAFFAETKDHWPADTRVTFSSNVSNDLRRELAAFEYKPDRTD